MNSIIFDTAREAGIIPVIALENVQDAVPLARALVAGGIRFAEITFRTEAACEAIRRVAKEVPEIIVGAGTVISTAQIAQAVEAGAKFLVSPGLDLDLLDAAQEKEIPIIPGVATPSELMQGLKRGIQCFKFFPASVYGGPAAIKALSAPFPGLRFIPTGGVALDNLESYLALKAVLAVGGSWMCPNHEIQEKNFEHIEELAREAIAKFQGMRGGQNGTQD